MNNDVLLAQKTEDGYRATVIDGESLEFQRQNKAIKDREQAKRLSDQRAKLEAAEKAKKEAFEKQQRKRRFLMGSALVLSTAALIGCVVFGLMHHILGMVFVSGASAAIGYRFK